MPKKNRAETRVTIQKISDAVTDQLLRLGYDKMSYTTLSQQTGISRTGISHHFPKKVDFMTELDSRIYGMLIAHLELDGELNQFSESWISSLRQPEFVSILRALFHHIVAIEKSKQPMQTSIDKLNRTLINKYGLESRRELEWLIGKSLIEINFRA